MTFVMVVELGMVIELIRSSVVIWKEPAFMGYKIGSQVIEPDPMGILHNLETDASP